MIYPPQHPGPWQQFIKKPENSLLSIQESTRKYKKQLIYFENYRHQVSQGSRIVDFSLRKYIFTLDSNNIDPSISGSALPNSSIVVTDTTSGDSFKYTPTDIDIPNANEMLVEDNTVWIGYNFVFNVNTEDLDTAYKLRRLENFKVDFNNSNISYDIAEDIYVKSGSEQLRQGHGFDSDGDYIYIGSRGTDGDDLYTRGLRVAKVNKRDFNDIDVYHYPADTNTASGDYLVYYDGYIYVQSHGGYTQLKITKINANDLSDYTTFADNVTGQIGVAGVLQIYKNTIITTTGYFNNIRLLQYSLDGTLLQNKAILPEKAGTKPYDFLVPHNSTIFGNYMYISQTFSYTDFLKINLDTFNLESQSRISTTLSAFPTDDVAIGEDNNLYVPIVYYGGITPEQQVSPRIVKLNPTDVSITTVPTNITNPFGSFSIKTNEERNKQQPL